MVIKEQVLTIKIPFSEALEMVPFPSTIFGENAERLFPVIPFKIHVAIHVVETITPVRMGITKINIGKVNILPYLRRTQELQFEEICHHHLKKNYELSLTTPSGR